jgi:hypothetical protein
MFAICVFAISPAVFLPPGNPYLRREEFEYRAKDDAIPARLSCEGRISSCAGRFAMRNGTGKSVDPQVIRFTRSHLPRATGEMRRSQ